VLVKAMGKFCVDLENHFDLRTLGYFQ